MKIFVAQMGRDVAVVRLGDDDKVKVFKAYSREETGRVRLLSTGDVNLFRDARSAVGHTHPDFVEALEAALTEMVEQYAVPR